MADAASGVAKFGLESVLRLHIMFRIFVFVQSIQCILSAWESSEESRKVLFPSLFLLNSPAPFLLDRKGREGEKEGRKEGKGGK